MNTVIGINYTGAESFSESTGFIFGSKIMNTAYDGVVTELRVYLVDSTPTGNMRIGLYTNSGGLPGTLIVDGGEAAVTDGWNIRSGLSAQVTADTLYWIVFTMSAGNNLGGLLDFSSDGVLMWAEYVYGALPNTISSPSTNGNAYAVLAVVSHSVPAKARFGLNMSYVQYKESALILNKYYNTAGTGTLTEIQIITGWEANSSGRHIRLGIYADDEGVPGALIYDAGEFDVPTTPYTWIVANGLNIPVDGDTYYWLAFFPSSEGTLNIGVMWDTQYLDWSFNHIYGPLPENVIITGGNAAVFVMRCIVDVETFGLNSGDQDWAVANFIVGARCQNTVGTGTLTKLEIQTGSGGNLAGVMVSLGVYADSGPGDVGDLLLDAGEVELPTDGLAWAEISGLSLPVTINTYYWLTFDCPGTPNLRYLSGSPEEFYRSAYGSPLPETITSENYNNNRFALRATVDRVIRGPFPMFLYA